MLGYQQNAVPVTNHKNQDKPLEEYAGGAEPLLSGFRLGLIRGKLLTLQSESLFVDSYLSLLIHHFQSVPGFAIFEHIEIPRVNVSTYRYVIVFNQCRYPKSSHPIVIDDDNFIFISFNF